MDFVIHVPQTQHAMERILHVQMVGTKMAVYASAVLLKIHLVPGQMITVVCLDFMMTMAHAPHVPKMQHVPGEQNSLHVTPDILNGKSYVCRAPGMCAMVKHLSVVAPDITNTMIDVWYVPRCNIVPRAQKALFAPKAHIKTLMAHAQNAPMAIIAPRARPTATIFMITVPPATIVPGTVVQNVTMMLCVPAEK